MLSKIIITFLSYALGLWAASYFVEGFVVNFEPTSFALLVSLFTIVHLIIRPLIKLVLSPLIIITLGLFNIVITAALLYIIDIYSVNISITGLSALIYGAVVVTVLSIVCNAFGHKSSQ